MLRKNILQKAVGLSSLKNLRAPHRFSLSKQFATLSIHEVKSQEVIRKALDASEKQQELDRFNEFCDKLYSVYEAEEQRKENFRRRDSELLVTSLSSKFPIRETLNAYVSYQSGFSDEHLASCLDHVARLYQIFKSQSSYYSDVSIEELLDTWKFRDMIDDVRYSLVQGIEASPENLEKVAKAFVRLGYQDHEVQAAFLDKAKRLLNNQDEGLVIDPEEAHKLPQYGKKGYYPKQGSISVRELLKNSDFRSYINKIMTPEGTTKTIADDSRTAEIDHLLEKLNRSVRQNQIAQSQFGQAILAIRDQFDALTEIQKEDFMAKNIFLRNELLELEEFLLEAGLLRIKDISNPQNISDPLLKRQNAANILHNLLLEQKETMIDPTISQYGDAIESLDRQKKTQQGAFNPEQLATTFNLDHFSRIVATLCDLANAKAGIKLDDTVSNNKWKQLLPQPIIEELNDTFNNLHLDFGKYRLPATYSKVWQSTFEFLQSNSADLLKQMSSRKASLESLEVGVNLAYAYSSVFLSGPAKKFLQGAASSQQFIGQLPLKSFLNLLKALNYVSNIDKKVFQQSILEYTNSHLNEITSEEALEIAHSLAVQGLANTKEFDSVLEIVNALEIDNVISEIEDYHREILYDLNLFLTHNQSQNAKRSLTPNLQSVAFVQRNVTDGIGVSKKEVLDPLQESIVKVLKQATSDSFANLLPNAAARLNKKYQPSVFCSDQDGKVGIFVGGGELVSIDENEISALARFRHSILENIGSLKCRAVSYNQFLNINYRAGSVSFKSNDTLKNVLEGVVVANKALNALKEVSYAVLDYFGTLPGATEGNASLKSFRVLCQHLENFFNTNKEYTSILEHGPRLIFNDRVKFRLAHLHAAFQNVDAATQKVINQLAQKHIGKDFYGLLQELKESFNAKALEAQPGESAEWFGLHYGAELASSAKGNIGKKNIDAELVNYPFLWDGDYGHYKDWNDLLEISLNENNLNFNTGLQGTDNFHTGRRMTPGLIPNARRVRNSIKPYSFPWNWEAFGYALPQDFFKKFLDTEKHNLSSQKPLDDAMNAIVNLQNLKAEWKATLSDAELTGRLVELDFLEDLMADHLGKEPKTQAERFNIHCSRDPRAYLGYLEKLSRVWVLKDPYTNFFLQRGAKKAQAISLRDEYEIKQKDLFKQFENHSVDKEQYEMAVTDLRDQYMARLKQLLEEQEPKDEIIPDTGKRFDVSFDYKSLVKQQDVAKFYDYREDLDYLRADQDAEELLNLKRRKAETKLIKLRLIKKLHEGIELSAIEKEYLRKWRESLQSTPLIDLDLNMVPKTYSNRNVRSISEKDRQYFGTLDFFDINSIGGLALNDLVLEISHFFDDAAINRLEKQVKGKEVSKEWGISSSFQFDTTENTEVRLVHDLIEEYAWRKSGEFSKEEREGIHEMFGILRGYTTTDKQWYAVDRKSLDEFIDTINPYDNRQQFLEEWFEKKEREILHRTRRTGPKNLMQSDNYYRENDAKETQNNLKENVQAAFNKRYEDISKSDLHIFVENLIERLYVLKKYLPKRLNFVIKGVLSHPNISILDRNNLQAALKMQGITLQLEESNVLTLNDVELSGTKFDKFSPEEIKAQLGNAKIPFVQDLCKKFQSI